jgi:hypothetical protein
LVVIGYFTLFFTEWLTGDALLWTATAFCVLFPLWFFRYARSLWLGFDYYFDPPAGYETESKEASPSQQSPSD